MCNLYVIARMNDIQNVIQMQNARFVQFHICMCSLYGAACMHPIQTAHTNLKLHKSCILHLYDILHVIHACDPIQTAHTKSWFLLSLLESLEVV